MNVFMFMLKTSLLMTLTNDEVSDISGYDMNYDLRSLKKITKFRT